MAQALQRRGKAVYKGKRGTRRIHSMFRTRQNKKYLSNNRAYSMCYLSLSNIAAFLGVKSSEANQLLQENRVFPKLYRERIPMYLVEDVSKMAKKIGKQFIIPLGYFDEPRTIYVGPEFDVLDKIWTSGKIWRFRSLLEMFAQVGIPTQTLYIGPSLIPKLEMEFVHAVCRSIKAYNKVHKKEEHKRVFLCTRVNHRDEALKLVEHCKELYPGVLCTIDLDHLIYLRRLAHHNYEKQHG